MPEIEIAAVVGVHHPRWDERPIADARRPVTACKVHGATDLVSWWLGPYGSAFVH